MSRNSYQRSGGVTYLKFKLSFQKDSDDQLVFSNIFLGNVGGSPHSPIRWGTQLSCENDNNATYVPAEKNETNDHLPFGHCVGTSTELATKEKSNFGTSLYISDDDGILFVELYNGLKVDPSPKEHEATLLCHVK